MKHQKLINKSFIFGFFVCLFLLGGIGVVLAVAINSNEVTYTNSKNANVETVEDALNDLYSRATVSENDNLSI